MEIIMAKLALSGALVGPLLIALGVAAGRRRVECLGFFLCAATIGLGAAALLIKLWGV